ncbi:cytochrome P450 [Amycolatopsis taiwanensis]|uniref:Cytochrome P450 n=1 Tax=Amycolatopsis taiwanensis TaxID=342230 RepID=A0A9W6R7G5_9PSEU|nr:cytochrome P450 [Amycolatopsis taiwanensis]GLY69675.1 cytochrome P450 [Amycolatopsis taiwanensis]
MVQPSTLPMLPRERVTHPFDLPPEYLALRKEAPISRFVWPNGVEGWLVTTYDLQREVLADNRFSIDRAGCMPPSLAVGRKPVMMPRSLVAMDPPEHTKWRRLIMRDLTPGKARALEPRIEAVTRKHLARMREQGPPVDLLPSLAFPVPSAIICELLGVPVADQDFFQHQTHVRSSVHSTPDEVDEATIALTEYLAGIVDEKKRHPADDLLSHLGQAEVDGEPVSREHMVGMAMLLLLAGHETTASTIGVGVANLMGRPDLIQELRTRESADRLVEEILRIHSVIQYGVLRRATEDVEVGGVRIAAGDWVTCLLASGNRDESRYQCSHAIDVNQPTVPHITFGYGVHQCVGMSLARVELRVVLRALFTEFPDLSPICPVEELRYREDMFVYGLYELPVRW